MPARTSAGLGRERSISAVCATGCGVLAVLIPLAVAALWTFGSWQVLALVRLVPADIIHHLPGDVLPWRRITGAAITLVPALLLSYGLLRARRSVAAFARGDFFAADVVDGLRGYAGATFWAAIASIVSVPVLSVAMTLANPPGQRELSADLSGAQLLSLLGAGIVWVIASAMARAAQIARENEEFV